jgi:capsular polysaccharide biosynthesis protein
VIEKHLWVRFIKNGWWLILLAMGAAMGAAWLLTSTATPLYQSSARYVISPSRMTASPNYGDMVHGIDALSRQTTVATYVEIFQSERAIDGAAEALGLDAATLADYTIAAVVLPETSVIHLSVTGPDPVMIQQLATAIGAEAVTYVRDLYDIYEINLLDVAKVPPLPFSPNLVRSIILAAVLGLMVGLLLALIRTPEILGNAEQAAAPPRRVHQPTTPVAQPRSTNAPEANPTMASPQSAGALKNAVPQQFYLVESAPTDGQLRYQLDQRAGNE